MKAPEADLNDTTSPMANPESLDSYEAPLGDVFADGLV